MILAGEELHRFGLQAELADIVHKTGVPVAATITGKSVFPESDPAYLGIYEGAMGRDSVRDYVEKSDCLVLLGAQMTDMNLGVYTARIDRRYAIYAGQRPHRHRPPFLRRRRHGRFRRAGWPPIRGSRARCRRSSIRSIPACSTRPTGR